MTTRSVASKQFRKQESFSQSPPVPPQRARLTKQSQASSQPELVDQTKKLTVSDAIGLITIRLSKVESYLLKNKDSIDGSVTSTTGEHADLDTIVRNLVNRINGLEKEHSVLKSIVETEEYQGQTQINSHSSPEPQIENLVNNEQFVSLSSRVEFLENEPKLANLANFDTLSSKVEKNSQEIQEMKQMVLKLQTMLLESLISKNVSTSVPSNSVSVDL
jgi:hypothetical protein